MSRYTAILNVEERDLHGEVTSAAALDEALQREMQKRTIQVTQNFDPTRPPIGTVVSAKVEGNRNVVEVDIFDHGDITGTLRFLAAGFISDQQDLGSEKKHSKIAAVTEVSACSAHACPSATPMRPTWCAQG